MPTSPTPSEEPAVPERRSGAQRRVSASRRVVTMAPSPWRRRKRMRPWVILSSATDIFMVFIFVTLIAFACWEAQSRQAVRHPRVTHAKVRPGASATPLPEAPEPPKP